VTIAAVLAAIVGGLVGRWAANCGPGSARWCAARFAVVPKTVKFLCDLGAFVELASKSIVLDDRGGRVRRRHRQ
jgi:hypothetical protein